MVDIAYPKPKRMSSVRKLISSLASKHFQVNALYFKTLVKARNFAVPLDKPDFLEEVYKCLFC